MLGFVMRDCGCNSLAGVVDNLSKAAAKAVLLRSVREAIQPIIAEISNVEPSKRAEAVANAFDLLGVPESADAIRRLAEKLVLEGVPAGAAYREALTRVLATNMLYVMPQQYEAARQRVLARGGDADKFTPLGLGNWLGDAYRTAKKGVTAVVKAGSKIAKKVTDIQEMVACNPLTIGAVSTVGAAAGGVGAAAGPALCGAAKAQKRVVDKVNSTVNPKKKKKKESKAAQAPSPAETPTMRVPVPSNTVRAPSRATSSTAARSTNKTKNDVRALSSKKQDEPQGRGGLIVVGLLAAGGLAYVVMRQRKLKAGKTAEKHDAHGTHKHKLHAKG